MGQVSSTLVCKGHGPLNADISISLVNQDILVSVPSRYPLVILDSLLGALTHQNSLKRRISFILIGVVYIITFISIYSARHQYVPASIRTAKLEFDNDMLADAQAAVYTEPTQSLAQRQSWIRLNKLVDSRSSAYPLKLFTDRALRMPNARVVGVTAVVLHWKRRKGLELVIKQLTKYPFIREVIVWNNRPGIELKASVGTRDLNRTGFSHADLVHSRTLSCRDTRHHCYQKRLCGSTIPRATCTTLASTLLARSPLTPIATSTTTTGSTFTSTRSTRNTLNAVTLDRRTVTRSAVES